MARHRKYEGEAPSDPALDISSLIDVCFLLLIYFIVTSSITKRESDLGMSLPASNPSTELPKIEPMLIRIDSNGAISVGTGSMQQPMDSDPGVRDLPLLKAQLDLYGNTARASNATPLVQIYADSDCTQQRVVDVLNALAGAGINAVTFTDLVN